MTGDAPGTAARWRVLVADDEPMARARLRALLARHDDFELVGECANGAAVLAALRDGPVDLLLLDVRMPRLDGVAAAEALAREAPWGDERPPRIVFVTASEEHAVRAFDLEAVDYLVKPIDIDRFDRALQRVREALGHGGGDAPAVGAAADAALRAALRALRSGAGAGAPEDGWPQRLAVRDAKGTYFVAVKDLDRVEADGNYAALVAGGRRHLVRETMLALEGRLDPAEFVRVHRSHIVRIERIRRVEACGHGEYELTLGDGTRLTTSRGYRDRVQRLLR